jgi:hypothetical protein
VRVCGRYGKIVSADLYDDELLVYYDDKRDAADAATGLNGLKLLAGPTLKVEYVHSSYPS